VSKNYKRGANEQQIIYYVEMICKKEGVAVMIVMNVKESVSKQVFVFALIILHSL